MKRTLTILGSAVLAAGMALAQPAPAANSSNSSRAGKWAAARQRWEQSLNLSDMQKQQAKTIFQSARQSALPLRNELRQDRQALRLAVKTNDPAQIQKLTAEEGHVIGKLMAVHSEAFARFYQDLTPAQRAKADQMQHNRPMRRRG